MAELREAVEVFDVEDRVTGDISEGVYLDQAERWEVEEHASLCGRIEALEAAIDRALAHRLDHGAQGNGYAQLVDRIRSELRTVVPTSPDSGRES